MKYKLSSNDQSLFTVIVYPTNNESGSAYNACVDAQMSDDADDLQSLIGRGDTAMAAIADLINQADRLTQGE